MTDREEEHDGCEGDEYTGELEGDVDDNRFGNPDGLLEQIRQP